MYNDKIKVIIYGTGNRCKQIMNITFFDKLVDVIAFVDSDVKNQGDVFEGNLIISPLDIKRYKYDYILIASVYYDEIKSNLVNKYNVSSDAIIEDAQNYLRNLSIGKRYNKCSLDLKKNNNNFFYDKKIVIYTAIFGNYDNLIDPSFINKNFDYVCFTDNKNLKSTIWNVIYVNSNDTNDHNRIAKEYKILPHKFFENYEYSIWVDANFKIKGDFIELLLEYLGDSNLALIIHPDRNCIYEEAEYCKLLKKDDIEIIDKQISNYYAEKYPTNNGLIAGGFIIRKHNLDEVITLMELWWKEINTYSKRDQISFNYVAWKLKSNYTIIPINIFENNFFEIVPHNK